MNFLESFSFYYSTILDVTSFIVFTLTSAGFLAIIWPKVLDKKNIIKLVVVFCVSFVVMILLNGFLFALARVTTQFIYNLTMPLIVCGFAAIFTNGKPIHKIMKTLILTATISVCDVLSKNFGFLIGVLIPEVTVAVVIARSLPSLFFFGTCFMFLKIDIAHYRNLSKEVIAVTGMLSGLLIIGAIIEHNYTTQDSIACALLSILDMILLLILGVSYVAIYKVVENRHQITSLEVQKTLSEAERMSMIIDANNREELEKLRHDLKNQLSYLNILLNESKVDEAKEYINNLCNAPEVLHSFSCSNTVINSIINLELTKAKIKGISVDVKVVVPPRLPFEDNDLVSLLTNIIDNALENYDGDSGNDITVQIIKQNDYIRFLVSNPVGPDATEKSIKKTSKKGRGHGYGTKIIRNIVSKYNGYVEFTVENQQFICDAVINLN